jgi:hypothetical protein
LSPDYSITFLSLYATSYKIGISGLKINNRGQIVGYGLFKGENRGFILNPTDQIIDPTPIVQPVPEPSTIIGSIFLGVGTVVNSARRRRGKQKS